MALAAATKGELRIRDAAPEDLSMIRRQFRRLGLQSMVEGDDVLVPPEQTLAVQDDIGEAIPKIDDGPWPAFPADLTSIALALATQAEGTILIFEKMFENRLFFVDKLVAMGARITLCDPHRAIVSGPSRLHGERVESPDIRAGMAMLIAALAAEGTSEIGNIAPDRPRLRAHRPAPSRAWGGHRASGRERVPRRRRPRSAAPPTSRGRERKPYARTDDPPIPPAPGTSCPTRCGSCGALQDALARRFERFGYGEVATPTIEYDEVLARGDAARRAGRLPLLRRARGAARACAPT